MLNILNQKTMSKQKFMEENGAYTLSMKKLSFINDCFQFILELKTSRKQNKYFYSLTVALAHSLLKLCYTIYFLI